MKIRGFLSKPADDSGYSVVIDCHGLVMVMTTGMSFEEAQDELRRIKNNNARIMSDTDAEDAEKLAFGN
jgi:hypothetical protein